MAESLLFREENEQLYETHWGKTGLWKRGRRRTTHEETGKMKEIEETRSVKRKLE